MYTVKWVSKLNELDEDGFIVAKDVNASGSKMFTSIRMNEVVNLLRNTSESDRVYYERIHAEKRQKPFFDIDGEKTSGQKFNENKFLKPYLDSIDHALSRKGIHDGYRLIVCSSSNEKKISYHIVVEGVYVPNMVTNKKFYSNVAYIFSRRYPDDDCLLDSSVYTKNRLFRLWRCRKYRSGKDRTKRLIKYMWNGDMYDYTTGKPEDKILLTMVSHVSKDVNKKISYPDDNVTKALETIDTELTQYNVNDLYSLYCDFAKANGMPVMKLRDTNNISTAKYIGLNRDSKRGKCIICNRTHDNDNAYLIVSRGQLLYKCFRGGSKSELIANLDDDTRDDEDIFMSDDDEDMVDE